MKNGAIPMLLIRVLAFVLAIGLGTIPTLAAIWKPQDAYAASRNLRSERQKALADCTHQANQQGLGQRSAAIKKKNFLRECLQQRGFSGPP
jgi:hypothetical protein